MRAHETTVVKNTFLLSILGTFAMLQIGKSIAF